MRILEVQFRNFTSYGNRIQSLTFDKSSNLFLLYGLNGSGKCLCPSTELEVKIEDDEIRQKFLQFLKNKYGYLPNP